MKELMKRQAVKRDIKFACRRTTSHIRTKLQRKCEADRLKDKKANLLQSSGVGQHQASQVENHEMQHFT